MAPKTLSGRVVGKVVTKKVVEETVEVVVSPTFGGTVDIEEDDNNLQQTLEAAIVASATKENEKVEVLYSSSSPKKSVRVVVVGDGEKPEKEAQEEREKQQEQEQEHEQQEEAEDKDKDKLDEDGDEDEDETQPEATPATPRKDEAQKGGHEKAAGAAQGEAQKETGHEKKAAHKRRKRKRARARMGEGYKRYVHRVMKQVHPEMGISSKAMTVINNLMSDMFERIADEAAKLSRYSGRRTLSSFEIQDAVKLVLPGDLGKHAIAEGAKAVSNYVSNTTPTHAQHSKSKS